MTVLTNVQKQFKTRPRIGRGNPQAMEGEEFMEDQWSDRDSGVAAIATRLADELRKCQPATSEACARQFKAIGSFHAIACGKLLTGGNQLSDDLVKLYTDLEAHDMKDKIRLQTIIEEAAKEGFLAIRECLKDERPSFRKVI